MRSYILIALRGMAMGMAEVVPGVSGGTIAFITGIYERLINAIKGINISNLKLLFAGKLSAFWKAIDGKFLLFLIGGMGTGIVTGVFSIAWLLEHHPLLIWGFFFGLILISCYLMLKQIAKWSISSIGLILAGTAIAYYVTVAQMGQGNEALWFVFLSGVIAISALLLPGLSGSFILLLMGMYTLILPTAKEVFSSFDTDALTILLVFMGGCLVGLFSFARLLSWSFKTFPNQTLAILTGFLIGSLNKVWPWQMVNATRVNSHGETVVATTRSVWPSTFSTLEENLVYGTEPKVIPVVICMALGFFLVLGIERAGKKLQA
ncbi:MAG: DUF368 domain-containing protein [Luteibaculum sp.]